MAKKAAPAHFMLRIKASGQPDRIEDLLGRRYVVGRGDPEGKVHVDFAIETDPHLSRAHCHLDRAGDTYAVENLSPNGTIVNGRPAEQPVALRHKDRIEIGGGTVLEFLRMTDTDRTRELSAVSVSPETEEPGKKKTEEKKKSFLNSPWMWGVLVFYGLLGLIVVSALGSKKEKVTDPGPGPYLESIRAEDLDPPPAQAGANELADRMWADARRRHDGENRHRGAHAFQLVRAAQRVVAIKGFGSLRDAASRKDPVAKEASDVISELEARLSNLYIEARQLRKSGHRERARRLYEQIRDAIPDRDIPLRRYAVQMAERLGKKKK